MRYQGTVAEWNAAKGFGFITRKGDGERVFVHVSACPRSRAPQLGTVWNFEIARDNRGRPHAVRLEPKHAVAREARITTGPLGTKWRCMVSGFFFASVAAACATGTSSWFVLVAYLGLSMISFFAYGWDKMLATRKKWRTAENTLHVLDLIGGWPGGYVGQSHFRHKWQKGSFVATFWITVAINVSAFGWSLHSGAALLDIL
ncbi:uncharacterized membrane protein YsdA (DUF1294 family) [Panacagrimonas perspica]|uniref:Uncharacterized membrane protein YsdA (DUF1294 family) n=1 Tax=Panacagrimonas perspica TaxID=381431 RepID=A0A4R7NZG7_9GAMM|nr:uncharacterized membrane protein YsdA (DUF1294 family) [Panacagrimonas perspica]THD04003.1 hypothetical protein B1810_07005 [Panacagrimonas perspica]